MDITSIKMLKLKGKLTRVGKLKAEDVCYYAGGQGLIIEVDGKDTCLAGLSEEECEIIGNFLDKNIEITLKTAPNLTGQDVELN